MATEKRPIDANALIEHLTRCIEQSKGLMRSVCVAIKCFVEQMPTVDAVERVRCKDCKHYVWDEFDGCYVCMELNKYVKTDFWCAYGERK